MSRQSWAQQVLARRQIWGRAPSAHNTQPWVVGVEDESLVIGWDETRHLAVGDPTRRDLMLGLGAVAQSLVIVAADLGHAVEVTWAVQVPSRRAAVVRRVGALDGRLPWTSADLIARRTARSAYRAPWVDPDQVSELAADAQLPAGAGLQVVDPDWVERWLPVADRWVLDGPAGTELARWVRLWPRHPSYTQDGLTDATLGLNRLEALGLRAALTGPVRRVLSRTGAIRLLAASATARPLGTVVMLTAAAGGDRPDLDRPDLDRLGHLGMALLRTWLAAADRGWAVHPLSALIDCPESLAAWPSTAGTPCAIFRLGVPTRPAAISARLSDQ